MASRRGQAIDGVLLLDKPEGLSSNHALQRVKRTLDARKAGHTGTLDPFATGLLVCCMGRATKLSTALLDADKRYLATLRFGVETDSGDPTGEVVAQAGADFHGVAASALQAVLDRFVGQIEQIPPMHSALKRDGKPLYAYARQGITLERAPRTITIHALTLIACDGMTAQIDVHCSKGTYVRTLAQDIGRALGCGAHLHALRRLGVGPFHLDEGIALQDLQALPDAKTALIALSALPAELRATISSKEPHDTRTA